MKKKPLIRAGTYQHFKGNLYKVVGIAKHSETLELMVVYRSQSSDHDLWVRPYEIFKETVEHEGNKISRFKYLHP